MVLSRKRAIKRQLTAALFFFFLAPLFFISSCKEDPEPPVEISFSSAVQSVVEGNQLDIFIPLERPATSVGKVVVQLSGSATYSEDYNTNPAGGAGSFELPIAAGATSVQFTVATINDNIYKGDRLIEIGLSSPSEGFSLGSQKSLTLTIVDDESQAIANFQTSVASVVENSVTGITVQIPFSMATQGAGSITVSWASNNATYNTHFTTLPAAVGNSITIAVPSDATGSSITLVPKDDSYFHENYVIVFEITATTGSVKAGTNKKLTVTIQEDENPSFASFPVTDGIVSETATAGIAVPIALSIPASETGTITVSFTSANAVYGTNFTTTPAASGTNILLNVAKNDTGATLTIFPIDNAVDNPDRVIFFTISGGGGVVRPAGNISYVLTITDNEPTLQRVLISFGSATAPLVTGADSWNHAYTDIPDPGVIWSNLKQANGMISPIDLQIITPLTDQPLGRTTGINSGVFPDNALKEYWYVPGPAEGISRSFSLLQVDDTRSYTIRIHGGTTFLSADGKNTMTISVNGDQKSLNDVTNNVTQILQWSEISPVASIFTVVLTDTDGGGICPINAMEISWFED